MPTTISSITPSSEDGFDDGDTLEVVTAGDIAPWVMIPQWILLTASGNAVKLYGILLAHVNQARGDQAAYPVVKDLCEWLGFAPKQARSVKRYTDELVALGALTVVQRRDSRGMRTRNKYILRHNPPDGFVGPRSFPEYYRRRNETAGRPVVRSSAPRSNQSKQDADHVSAGESVVRSSAPRSAPQRTPVVRSSAPKLKELKNKESSSSRPRAEQLVLAAGATEDEMTKVLQIIKDTHKPRNLAAYLARMTETGDLAALITEIRTPSTAEGLKTSPRCNDTRHDPDAPNDRNLYEEDGTIHRCPDCHPLS